MLEGLLRNKKGVSPLIATVLLIAFAVSLGAVLMNLGLSVFGDPCKPIDAEVLTLEGMARICLNPTAGALQMTINNPTKSPVDGFKISVLGDTALNDDVVELMKPQERKIVKYPVGNMSHVDSVTIIPLYQKQGQIFYCPQKAHDYVSIPKCF